MSVRALGLTYGGCVVEDFFMYSQMPTKRALETQDTENQERTSPKCLINNYFFDSMFSDVALELVFNPDYVHLSFFLHTALSSHFHTLGAI
jgi:hypothetical protein